jgi:hypothetical protein
MKLGYPLGSPTYFMEEGKGWWYVCRGMVIVIVLNNIKVLLHCLKIVQANRPAMEG